LGYTFAQDCGLAGQNVRHLHRFLKNQESNAASAQDVLQGVGNYNHGNVNFNFHLTEHRSAMNFSLLRRDSC
jgi:hypothetical protein